jgi:ATP-dependent DNA helicase RecG
MKTNELISLLKKGESEHLEFKEKVTNSINKEIVAFANADGGYILIGIKDNGKIVGTDTKKGIEYITNSSQSIIPLPSFSTFKHKVNEKNILGIKINKSNHLCSIGGIAYIRIGSGIRPLSIQEILRLSSELGTIAWDAAPLIPFSNAKQEYVNWFFDSLNESRGKRIEKKHRLRYLRSIKAISNKQLTNAGILFFTDTQEYIPHSKIRIIYLEEKEIVGSKEYDGPVWKMIEDSYNDLNRELGKKDLLISSRRKKFKRYPSKILREALINAVAHRNYSLDADIRIFLSEHNITIRNPGGLLPGVDLKDPEHIPRNPSLCNLLYDAGFIERYGFGIKMIRGEIQTYPSLSLHFGKTSHRFDISYEENPGIILEDMDKQILKVLSEPLKSSQISKRIGVTKPTMLSHLKKLEKLGLVKQKGSGPQTKYISV